LVDILGSPFDELRATCTQLYILMAGRDHRVDRYPPVVHRDALHHQPE